MMPSTSRSCKLDVLSHTFTVCLYIYYQRTGRHEPTVRESHSSQAVNGESLKLPGPHSGLRSSPVYEHPLSATGR